MDDVRLSAQNPLRPVDWRFRLATRLVRTGRFSSGNCYDDATCLLADYLRIRQRGGHTMRRDRTPARVRDLHAAFELHANCHSQLCAAIEAALLTADEFASIARKVGTSVECLRWYEAIFFDVRSRLPARHYILHDVIDVCRHRHADDWPSYGWKLLAYWGGSRVLDEVLGTGAIDGLQQFCARMQQQMQAVVLEKLHRHINQSSIENPAQLAKLFQFSMNAKTSGEHVPSELEKSVQAVLESFRWCVGPLPDPNSRLEAYDDLSVELRPDEMIQVAMGQTLPDAAILQSVRYPESPPATQYNK